MAGRAAVVSEKLQFISDRVSKTCVVRYYHSHDTAETVTIYIDICVCNVFGFRVWSHARLLVSPGFLRSKITGL